MGRKIEGIFNEVIGVIILLEGGKEGRHMQLLVEFDLTKPLPRGTTIKCNGNW